MSHKIQKGHMWGCWIVWEIMEYDDRKWHEEWLWDIVELDKDNYYFPLVFTETRREIMSLIKEMREMYNVKSAKAIKVPIPRHDK